MRSAAWGGRECSFSFFYDTYWPRETGRRLSPVDAPRAWTISTRFPAGRTSLVEEVVGDCGQGDEEHWGGLGGAAAAHLHDVGLNQGVLGGLPVVGAVARGSDARRDG
jgi:hypothetical protein